MDGAGNEAAADEDQEFGDSGDESRYDEENKEQRNPSSRDSTEIVH